MSLLFFLSFCLFLLFFFFFFNDTATTEIYTLSLHDALPISVILVLPPARRGAWREVGFEALRHPGMRGRFITFERSEEHTSELQSRQYLVCRLLLEKKKNRMFIFADNARILVRRDRGRPQKV